MALDHLSAHASADGGLRQDIGNTFGPRNRFTRDGLRYHFFRPESRSFHGGFSSSVSFPKTTNHLPPLALRKAVTGATFKIGGLFLVGGVYDSENGDGLRCDIPCGRSARFCAWHHRKRPSPRNLSRKPSAQPCAHPQRPGRPPSRQS